MKELKGAGTSGGAAVARAYKIDVIESFPSDDMISFDVKQDEKDRFLSAVGRLGSRLEAKKRAFMELGNKAAADYMLIQESIVLDKILEESVLEFIGNEYSAVSAVSLAVKKQVDFIKKLNNPVVSGKIPDIEEAGSRISYMLCGLNYPDISYLEDECILVARDIPVSLMRKADAGMIKGVILEDGLPKGHLSLLLLDMEIPTVVQCRGAFDGIAQGGYVCVDGATGEVEYEMNASDMKAAMKKALSSLEEKRDLKKYSSLPTITADGESFTLFTNVIDLNTSARYEKMGADGIGLFRTDEIYAERDDLPSETEHFEIYEGITKRLGGKPIIIRTMDGGKKRIKSLNIPEQENPALGYRSIRTSLDRTDVLMTQIRAILRASAFGNVSVLFPFITHVGEVKTINKLLARAKAELKEEGREYDPNIKTGIVIEVPSAAIMAYDLIKYVDFFAISVNNLTQYLLACGRLNPLLSGRLNCLEPSVIRVLKMVCDAAKNAGKRCYAYGEMLAEPKTTALFVGLEIDALSLNPSSILKTRRQIKGIDAKAARNAVARALEVDSLVEINKIMEQF